MERNVGQKNVQILRSLLQKQYEEAIAKLRDGAGFVYNFTKDKPYFELVLRVDERDFAVKAMEAEIGQLTSEVNTLKAALKMTEKEVPIHENIVEFGNHDVLSHQKRGNFHRLVLCCKPPQKVSAWVPKEESAELGKYHATWDEVDEIPF